MKKFLSLTLSTLMLFSVLGASLPAFAEETTETIESEEFLLGEINYADEEQIEGFGVISNRAITDPQFPYEDVSNEVPYEVDPDGNVFYSSSNYSIIGENENKDVSITLAGLDQNYNTSTANDAGGFKNIYNLKVGNSYQHNVASLNTAYLSQYYSLQYSDSYLSPTVQGVCSDGEYVYYSFVIYERNKTAFGKVGKQQIGVGILSGVFNEDGVFETKKVVCDKQPGCSRLTDLKHANSLTYNKLGDRIVVACGDGEHQYIRHVNADFFRDGTSTSLNVVEKSINCKATNIAYNERKNEYVVEVTGQTKYFAVLDSDFNLVSVINNSNENSDDLLLGKNLALQSIMCDDNYIYACYYFLNTATPEENKPPEIRQNVIVVFDWEGNIIKEININIPRYYYNGAIVSYELEDMTMHGDKVIASFNVYYKQGNEQIRYPRLYFYDLSEYISTDAPSNFFNIEYRSDDNVSTPSPADSYSQNIFYGLPTNTLQNTFLKTGKRFAGWNLYSVEHNKWYYESADSSTRGWYQEGSQPTGYRKCVYGNCTAVSRTTTAGNHVIFCATWTNDSNIHIEFDSNGGVGTKNPLNIVYGSSVSLPTNSFTKKVSGKEQSLQDLAFQGWNIFWVEKGRWLYKNSSDNMQWYKEDSQPAGYTKAIINSGANLSTLVPAGGNLILFAAWDEFFVYYHANGLRVKAESVSNFIARSFKHGSSSNPKLSEFNQSNTENNITVTQFHASRPDMQTRRYIVGDGYQWLSPNNANGLDYAIYTTSTSIKQTAPIGERVVFSAEF